MAQIQRRKDGSKLMNMCIRLEDYANDPILAPLSDVRRTLTPIDNTNVVQTDPARLMLVFAQLRAKDFKYYFYVLARLERNDKPIRISIADMREQLKEKWKEQVYQALTRLCVVGLLFKVEAKFEQYLVNPAYAWKGNRFDYLDTDSLPIINE